VDRLCWSFPPLKPIEANSSKNKKNSRMNKLTLRLGEANSHSSSGEAIGLPTQAMEEKEIKKNKILTNY